MINRLVTWWIHGEDRALSLQTIKTLTSSALNSSQIWTTLSALPPVTIDPSADHAQLSNPFSALWVPPTNVLSCRFFFPDESSMNGRISHERNVPSMELLRRCVPLGLSARHVMVSMWQKKQTMAHYEIHADEKGWRCTAPFHLLLTCMSLHSHRFMHLSYIPCCNTIIYPTRVHNIAIIGIGYCRELIIVREATHLATDTSVPQFGCTVIASTYCKCCWSSGEKG